MVRFGVVGWRVGGCCAAIPGPVAAGPIPCRKSAFTSDHSPSAAPVKIRQPFMDRKSIVILLLSVLFLISWSRLVEKWYPQPAGKAKSAPGTNSVTNTNASNTNQSSGFGKLVDGTNSTPQTASTTAPGIGSSVLRAGTNGVPTTGTMVGPQIAVPEKLLELETELSRYTFTSRGGGIKTVALKKHLERVGRLAEFGAGRLITLNDRAPVPIGTLFLEGALDEKTPYELTQTNNTVYAQKVFPDGSIILKTFRPSTNYLIDVSVRFENRAPGSVLKKLEHYFVTGTATPLDPKDIGLYVKFDWFDGEDDHMTDAAWFKNNYLMCIPGTPRETYTTEENIHWTAVMNQFFTVTAIPEEPAPRIIAKKIMLPKWTAAELAPGEKPKKAPYGLQVGVGYPSSEIRPGAENAMVHNYRIYAGPKEYKTLAKMATERSNEIDLVSDLDGWILVDGFFARALLLAMDTLHGMGLSYAWAIILITIIIKLLFWPLTNASTKSMKRMAEFQPQMKEIQAKYKEDPQKMNRKTMEFMKENKVNPLGGCLPMLLQLPVFLGFFTMLRSAVELRGAQFLWVTDLAAPDTIAYVAGLPINILPLFMGATMLWQSSLSPPAPGMDPAQQKVMKYLPMIFMFILYNFAAALTLYWTVQNLLTVLQTKITKSGDQKKDGKKKDAKTGKAAIAKKDETGIVGKGPMKKRGKK
jgi:YidC/Oxa1 family membrane protein insertase